MSAPVSILPTTASAQLSPAQASFVYWLNGLAPVLTSIVTPLATYWTLRKKPDKTAIQKYNQQVNEVVRQFVSGTVGLVGYFGGGESTKGVLNVLGSFLQGPAQLSESTKQVLMIVGGTAISFIGYAFIRPKISTELICKLLKQEEGQLIKPDAVAPDGWMKKLQQWVDKTLITEGKPNLRKTAVVSAGFLTTYLGGGALLIGGLKKLFQGEPKNAPSVYHATGSNTTGPVVRSMQPWDLYFSRQMAQRSFPSPYLSTRNGGIQRI